jgi:hypothetical protein
MEVSVEPGAVDSRIIRPTLAPAVAGTVSILKVTLMSWETC